MKIAGEILEEVYYFCPRERAEWLSPEVPAWLITEPRHRFLYCRINDDYTPRGDVPYDFDRIFYFMMARYIADHHAENDMMWHERYKLALKKVKGKYVRSNVEIEELMGSEICERLRRLNANWSTIFQEQAAAFSSKKSITFKDPDLVAYGDGRFRFLELKSKGEGFRPFQLESLAILRHFVPGSEVRVVRTLEHGSAYELVPHPYDFDIPDMQLE